MAIAKAGDHCTFYNSSSAWIASNLEFAEPFHPEGVRKQSVGGNHQRNPIHFVCEMCVVDANEDFLDAKKTCVIKITFLQFFRHPLTDTL